MSPAYEENKIINHRGEAGAYEYLVDWRGYAESDRSWEPEKNFLDTKCIEQYWRDLSHRQEE